MAASSSEANIIDTKTAPITPVNNTPITNHSKVLSNNSVSTTSDNLSPNQKKRSENSFLNNYNCTNCDIKFDSESSLRVHLQVSLMI